MGNEQKKKRINMTIKRLIITCVITPVIILGIIMLVLTATLVRGSFLNYIKTSLKGTACSTEMIFEQMDGTYEMGADGVLKKGDFVVNNAQDMVDSITRYTGMGITFLYGDTVVLSSVKDANNYRITEIPLTDKMIAGDYFAENIVIDGKDCFAYSVGVYANSSASEPIGLVVVSMENAKAYSDIMLIIGIIVVALIIVVVGCVVTTTFIVSPMVDALKQSIRGVTGLSEGQLDIIIRGPVLERTDEIGDLGRSVENLKNSLRDMLQAIGSSAKSVNYASVELSNTAKDMYQKISGVISEVDFITEGASTQATDTQSALESMTYMGDLIIRTGEKAKSLNAGADSMKNSGDQAFDSIKELRSFSQEVRKAIDMIAEQTNKTNESARQIQTATKFISEIASETDLLSLNASIEAARAGEAGRGFSVVASQIQKLAEQSNNASGSIDEIVETLLRDSTQMVNTMYEFQDVIEQQNTHIELTGQTFSHVVEEIGVSIENIKEIESISRELEASRQQVQQIIETLSGIAQDNVTSTERTNASISEVAQKFKSVQHASNRLKSTADVLADNTNNFVM